MYQHKLKVGLLLYNFLNLTNANACDSTAILNLTINNADTSYTNITACDSVVWNGITYNSSGTYSYSGAGSGSNITGFTYGGFFNNSYQYYIIPNEM